MKRRNSLLSELVFIFRQPNLVLHKFGNVSLVITSLNQDSSIVSFVVLQMIRRSYDSDDSDFATAVAASVYAIHSQLKITKANTRHQGGSIRKPSIQDTRSPSFMRPPLPFSQDQRQKNPSSQLTNSDAWEKDKIAKIRNRYEKMQSEILGWQNEKKLREKREMEKKKGEVERIKSRNLKHYQSKLSRIDNIAGEARVQVEEKRKHQESIIKHKARKMRSTGKTPVNCFCF